jgi:hypothetical protein
MKRAATNYVTVPLDPDIKHLIKEAAVKTHASQAEVIRSALHVGVPQFVKQSERRRRPRRNLIEYLDAFAGLVEPVRR